MLVQSRVPGYLRWLVTTFTVNDGLTGCYSAKGEAFVSEARTSSGNVSPASGGHAQ